MNIVEKYYMRKASMGSNDMYYDAIETADIEILRRAQAYLLIAPTATIALVYVLNKLRYEVFMSQHFFYIIKRYQDKMQSKYKREQAKRDGKEEE